MYYEIQLFDYNFMSNIRFNHVSVLSCWKQAQLTAENWYNPNVDLTGEEGDEDTILMRGARLAGVEGKLKGGETQLKGEELHFHLELAK